MKPHRSGRAVAGLAGTIILACLALCLAVLGLIALLAGGAARLPGTDRSLELAPGYDEAAHKLLARSPKPIEIDEAERLSRRALKLAPYDTTASMRLAYADTVRQGHLTDRGVAALRLSYRQAPFDQYIAYWRIKFALDHWGALPADLRRSVAAEARALMSSSQHRQNLRITLRSVSDPSGRVVSALWLSHMNSERDR